MSKKVRWSSKMVTYVRVVVATTVETVTVLTVDVTVAGEGEAVTVLVTGAMGNREEHNDCNGE